MSKAIEPVIRALKILQAMNQQPLSTISALREVTALPKSTIHRLLATLIEAGYIKKDTDLGVYSLTPQVLTLAQGFHQKLWLVDAAAPIAEAITRKVKWPIAISTFELDAMVVRYSTRGRSPLIMRNSTVNQRFPLLYSAMGQAYLGFCDSSQRKYILAMLRDQEPDPLAIVHNKRWVQRLINKTELRGYGLRIGNKGESTHIALPIRLDQEVQGVIGISLFSSCYNETSSTEYVKLLKQAAEDIQREAL